MHNKTTRALCSALLFSLAAGILSVYQYAGIPASVLAFLLAGATLEPLFAMLSVAVYLVAGIWLPVYPLATHGTSVLFGSTGGFLWALLLCVLAISAMRKGLKNDPVLALALGLLISFVLYFGVGILWIVVSSSGETSFKEMLHSNLQTPCMLYGLDCLLTLLVAPRLRKTV